MMEALEKYCKNARLYPMLEIIERRVECLPEEMRVWVRNDQAINGFRLQIY